ncbi:hypothetical protein AaE_002738, partial [Aphanomyces astaci]
MYSFCRFHMTNKMLLVPTGTKRVGSVNPIDDEKKGVTLAVACEVYSSMLLPPFIVDTGEFGAKLMHDWHHYKKSVVVFNATHWMTQYIFTIFLAWLKTLFKGDKIGVVVDRSRTHYGDVVDTWLKSKEGQDIVVEFIAEGMTS